MAHLFYKTRLYIVSPVHQVPLSNNTVSDAGDGTESSNSTDSVSSITSSTLSAINSTLVATVTDSILSSATASVNSTTSTTAFSANATDSSITATATDPSVSASITDSSDPYSSLPTVTNTDSQTSTDTSILSSTDAAAPTDAPVSTGMPVSPPACVAKAAGVAAGTTSSDDSTPTDVSSTIYLSTSVFTTLSSQSTASTTSTVIPSTASSVTVTPTVTTSVSSALRTDGSNSPIPTNATISKRIAQADLRAVAQAWQDLCLVSGGDIFTNEPCVQLAGINGINALLADADPCAQQDNADAMIDFAKSPGVTNTDALVANAIAYRQHPRNAININGIVPSTPFCENAPRNQELVGIVNAQLQGVDFGIFGSVQFGLVAFGANGTCPFGQTADIDTCSCS
ncbi:hypothetical protein A0H81_10788 [Grifola frondosa]|uniref:Uncharacterized protein n=1 Tax=Grifola frondosa TaxID=5627 RepID=A0A1C7LXG8_GRIFR|nr:hypothetical protein A0H81_10788 [Grifola frondosa]